MVWMVDNWVITSKEVVARKSGICWSKLRTNRLVCHFGFVHGDVGRMVSLEDALHDIGE